VLLEPIRRPRRSVPIAATGNPQVAMILPGFATHPMRMRYLARQLESAGHVAKRWGLGFNWGPTDENFAAIEERLLQLHARHGRKVVLIGWSLGGIFAREVAKAHPEAVRLVVTMGTPFSGDRRANNAWRAYQLIAGHSVDEPPIGQDMSAKLPVPTVALWSPRDGIIAPRSACGRKGERDLAIPMRCTHLGFAAHPDVAAMLKRLVAAY